MHDTIHVCVPFFSLPRLFICLYGWLYCSPTAGPAHWAIKPIFNGTEVFAVVSIDLVRRSVNEFIHLFLTEHCNLSTAFSNSGGHQVEKLKRFKVVATK